MSNTKFTHTLLEVSAVMTSYMRMTHGLSLEIDQEKLARLLADAPEVDPTPAPKRMPEGQPLEILVVGETLVRVRLPAGFPVEKWAGRQAYYAPTPLGSIAIAAKFLTPDKTAIQDTQERDHRIGKKLAATLEVGIMQAAAPKAAAPEVDPTPAPKADKPKKLTREDRRLADHMAHSCTCQRPPGHICPAVVDYGADILPLEVVLEKIAAEKAAK